MPATKKSQSFRAFLEPGQNNLGWTIIRIPEKVSRAFASRGMLKVRGTINDFPFRTSLFPTGQGTHTLLVNKAMQKGADVRIGSTAQFHLELDVAERKIKIPPALTKILKQDRAFLRWFATLNYSTRKWLTHWISQPQSPASRLRRTEQIAEQLFSAMDAERELPPAIKSALTREPHALAGWNTMSRIQRRGQLIAIFYYRHPASRDRRIAKVVAACVARATSQSAPE